MDNTISQLQQFFSPLVMANPSELAQIWLQRFSSLFQVNDIAELTASAATSFALIAAAEIGDKSQLVCMTLATRHKPMPVLLGAVAAFVLLDTLAVVFGVAIANWLPSYLVAAIVALLFAIFGLQALRVKTDDEGTEVKEKSGHSIFLTTFLLITVAEFGDKTQLAVVGLSSTSIPAAVWLGATTALAFTSALGIIAGSTVLKKMPLSLLHKISGVFFLLLASFACYQAYQDYTQ